MAKSEQELKQASLREWARANGRKVLHECSYWNGAWRCTVEMADGTQRRVRYQGPPRRRRRLDGTLMSTAPRGWRLQ